MDIQNPIWKWGLNKGLQIKNIFKNILKTRFINLGQFGQQIFPEPNHPFTPSSSPRTRTAPKHKLNQKFWNLKNIKQHPSIYLFVSLKLCTPGEAINLNNVSDTNIFPPFLSLPYFPPLHHHRNHRHFTKPPSKPRLTGWSFSEQCQILQSWSEWSLRSAVRWSMHD